eukprot:SAG31_NODE_1898_length_6963_cov_2.362325_1_plen_115_part_00
MVVGGAGVDVAVAVVVVVVVVGVELWRRCGGAAWALDHLHRRRDGDGDGLGGTYSSRASARLPARRRRLVHQIDLNLVLRKLGNVMLVGLLLFYIVPIHTNQLSNASRTKEARY